MLPPLATVLDLTDRLGESVVVDTALATALLDDASVLVRATAGQDWVTEDRTALEGVPDVAVFVALAVAKRAYTSPNGIAQKTAGDVSISYAPRSAADVYLTAAEKQMLNSAVGRSGLRTITTTRGDLSADTVYVPVVGAPPFPWYDASDPTIA